MREEVTLLQNQQLFQESTNHWIFLGTTWASTFSFYLGCLLSSNMPSSMQVCVWDSIGFGQVGSSLHRLKGGCLLMSRGL